MKPSLPLPIDSLLPEIVQALRDGTSLLVEAPPGAGKTTRVPGALLDAGIPGEVVVLQPRRLPARLAAERVAEERGGRVGDLVGYTIRFEDVSGPATRLRFVTEGVLVRRLLAHPRLDGVGAVLLDEFHERHLATDLTLALLRELQNGPRPDLRLVVMSATLEADPVRAYLGQCPVVRSEGRVFPVDTEYLQRPDDRPLSDQVAGTVRRLILDGLEGDLLVFLPGAAEIRRCAEALAPLADQRGLLVLPLHGELPFAEQNRAVRPAQRPKVILSTNVAETSVTIDGVVAVIDSGLARIAAHSPWTGLPTLMTDKISQASAIQRAGRAGRTRPGRAVRLYTKHDFDSRRPFDLPEIARLDLAEPLLMLHALGVRDPQRFPWFEAPPPVAMSAARELLRRLGAVAEDGTMTEVGLQMLRFPVHPRLARLVVEGERRGVGPAAATLAAMVAEGDIADEDRAGGDLLERLDRFEQARAARFSRDRLRGLGVNGRRAEAVEKARRQLDARVKRGPPSSPEATDEALAIATLAAFPDRVMRRRAVGASDAVVAVGGNAEVPSMPPDELLVGVDLAERGVASGRGRSGVRVRLAVGIQAEWLLDLLPDALESTDQLVWNAQTERVDRLSRLGYGLVTLEETRRPAEPSAEASRLLEVEARASGFEESSSGELAVRLELLEMAAPDQGGQLAVACEGRTSLAELREADLHGLSRLDPGLQQRLRTETPERVRLPSGREATVHYEAGKPPWIESRLQDFFGATAGPTICRGRVPLTIHLLAPNGRAVQVTRDLSGFWRQHYPAIRRELGRKYPRHAWPEDGANALPPPRRK